MSALLDLIRERFPDALSASHAWRSDETGVLRVPALVEVARFLKEDPRLAMNFLMDLTAVDYSTFGQSPLLGLYTSSGSAVRPSSLIEDEDPWPGPPGAARFVMVYHFYSTEHKHRLRLVVPLEDSDPTVETLTPLWPAANWLERETWDMYGINFHGHPDMRRLLMYKEFEGHPLRKDYPVNKRQPLVGPMN